MTPCSLCMMQNTLNAVYTEWCAFDIYKSLYNIPNMSTNPSPINDCPQSFTTISAVQDTVVNWTTKFVLNESIFLINFLLNLWHCFQNLRHFENQLQYLVVSLSLHYRQISVTFQVSLLLWFIKTLKGSHSLKFVDHVRLETETQQSKGWLSVCNLNCFDSNPAPSCL